MMIDEAIRHAEEVTEEQEELYRLCPASESEIFYCDGTKDCKVLKNGKNKGCQKCAAEHRQLTAWLRELKAFRERSNPDGYSSHLWKNAYNRGWQDALSRAEDEAYDIIIDGEVFRCIQVETLIGLGMSRETEPYRNHIR